jgi:hypothetical protein
VVPVNSTEDGLRHSVFVQQTLQLAKIKLAITIHISFSELQSFFSRSILAPLAGKSY